MIRELVQWFYDNGYVMEISEAGKLKYRFVRGERPLQADLDAKIEQITEQRAAVTEYVKKIPLYHAAIREWAARWEAWKADPDPAHTRAHQQGYAEAAIRLRIPFYADGVNLGAYGWKTWAGLRTPEVAEVPAPEIEI